MAKKRAAKKEEVAEEVVAEERDLGPARRRVLDWLHAQPPAAELYAGCATREERDDMRAWIEYEWLKA